MPIKTTSGPPTFSRNVKMLSNKTIFQSLTKISLSLVIAAVVTVQTGCQSVVQQVETLGLHPNSTINFAAANPPQSKLDSGKSIDQRYSELAGFQPIENTNSLANGDVAVRAQSPGSGSRGSGFGFPPGSQSLFGSQQPTTTSAANTNQTPVQAANQTAAQNQFSPTAQSNSSSAASQVAARLQAKVNDTGQTGAGSGSRVTTADHQQTNQDNGEIAKVAYQYPELATPDRLTIPGNGLASPNIGSPNELNPLIQPFERGGNAPIPFPANYADLDVYVSETETGRINFGGAFNSDNGIVGQFRIDERNFDITRLPTSFGDLINGTAFRGGGQQFSLELAPGQDLQRYSVNLTEPYLLGTNYSLSLSGYLFDRSFFDWDEQRIGGRIALGRRLTPDLSISLGFRGERVELDNARATTSPTLNAILNEKNSLFLFNVGLIRDTRDSQLAATEGTYFSATLTQAFGDFDYTRGDFDFRTYKLLKERADGTGRHTVSFGTKLGFSGSSTPIFENYFAGGFSTFRGFDFRGVGPSEGGVRIGGPFQWLNTVEYQFPILADDSVKGVLFCDFGTIEESITLNSENFRVAPGFGFRVDIPGLGIGAPLAFDFAFPVADAAGDEEQVFSFFLGLAR